MSSCGQFCPGAKAMEVLGEDLREIVMALGVCDFDPGFEMTA